jgi:hypothetical protein
VGGEGRGFRKGGVTEVSDGLVSGKSAREFFREMVTDVLGRQRLKILEVTEFYLVNLLSEYLQTEKLFLQAEDGAIHREPLALILKKALEADREERFRTLKRLGDTSLFVSGFFGDSLSRSLVDVEYYISMGSQSYDALKESRPGKTDELFGELSARFPNFVDLFAEIAELSQLKSNRGLLKLYERFLHTRSERVAEMLQQRGVALFGGPAVKKGLVH